MASLSLSHINKTYPNGFEAVKDFNLEIEDKEFIIFRPLANINNRLCIVSLHFHIGFCGLLVTIHIAVKIIL